MTTTKKTTSQADAGSALDPGPAQQASNNASTGSPPGTEPRAVSGMTLPDYIIDALETSWEPPASTSEALMRVMRSVDAVEKETRQGINYAFRTIDGLYHNLHAHLAREGVIIRIDTDFLDFDTTGTIGSNVNTTRITAKCAAVATSPWDEKEVVLGSGIFLGQDSSDKGPGKLHSYAYKTIVSSAFSIPIAGNDIEADSEQTGHGWYGWESKADHDDDRSVLYARLKALPDEFRDVAVDALKKQRVIDDKGHLLTRLTPTKMGKLEAEVATAESAAAGAEPF